MTPPNTTLERDPVCGMNVDPAKAKYTAEHSGKKYFFCCCSCADKFVLHPQAYAHKPSSGCLLTPAMPTPKPQPTERDPVCGMNVNPATAKWVSERGGKKTHFCSLGCLEKFEADPAKYLNKPSGLVTLGAPATVKIALVPQFPGPKSDVRGQASY